MGFRHDSGIHQSRFRVVDLLGNLGKIMKGVQVTFRTEMLGKTSSRRVEFFALDKSSASLEKSQSIALSDLPSVPLFKSNLRFS